MSANPSELTRTEQGSGAGGLATIDPELAAALEHCNEALSQALPITDPDDRMDTLSRTVHYHAALTAMIEKAEQQCSAIVAWANSRIKALHHSGRMREAETLTFQLLDGPQGGGGRRSVDTPYGRAGLRKKPDKLTVTDEQAVIAAVKAGQLPAECMKTETTEYLVMAELTKLYKAGEIPPGCAEVKGADVFYIQ